MLLSAALPAARSPADDLLAFPGAQGAAAHTPGGRGGKILRVTTLAPSGPGSLLAALETTGPRIVVFEVGGVIDFARHEIKITKPYLTVAGQTAPSPGITLIRTGIDVTTHDVVLQHIRVRTGSADAPKRGGWEPDAFSTQGAHDVIVDHCSMTWAHRREPVGLRAALHRQDAAKNGAAARRIASPSATTSSPRG